MSVPWHEVVTLARPSPTMCSVAFGNFREDQGKRLNKVSTPFIGLNSNKVETSRTLVVRSWRIALTQINAIGDAINFG